MGQPLISIVIANYNYGRFLEEAIKSIVEQDAFEKCELIVVDGGSTDNSVEVIKKYADKISWWCSEKDEGQSDAFNKGFSHANGRLGCWVNADDILISGTLEAVISYVNLHPDAEWITGGTIFFDERSVIWRARIGTNITNNMHKWVDPTVIGGPSSFFRVNRLREVGGFNVRLRYTMDGDLWNKFFHVGMKMHHINRYFWGFRVHAASKTAHSLNSSRSEEFRLEDALVFARRNYTAREMWVAGKRLFAWKLLNGSMFRSAFDTIRLNGKNILDFRR